MSAELQPLAADWRLAERLPWLTVVREGIQVPWRAGRLPHALLLEGAAGVGKGALADWIARLALCERRAQAPCGHCTSCHLHAAGTHPDLFRVVLAEDRKDIAVDDVRELIAVLSLKSYRGGAKVAMVDPADSLNASGANALLKTLEEPAPNTLLILIASHPERLPATIRSRCQRIRVPRPPAADALAWLEREGGGHWQAVLALAGGGPLAAVALGQAGGQALAEDMERLLEGMPRRSVDLVAAAERAAKDHPQERLRWIENWITDRIRDALGSRAARHTPPTPPLPATGQRRHIRDLYTLLDDTRRAQLLLRGTANVQLILESVLTAWAACMAPQRGSGATG
jgi:DNA polymerase III subunit delta'